MEWSGGDKAARREAFSRSCPLSRGKQSGAAQAGFLGSSGRPLEGETGLIENTNLWIILTGHVAISEVNHSNFLAIPETQDRKSF